MKLNIKRNPDNEVIGWDLVPETQEEEKDICIMRNAIFFGLDETKIEYVGRSGNDSNKNWPIDRLMWRKHKYCNCLD